MSTFSTTFKPQSYTPNHHNCNHNPKPHRNPHPHPHNHHYRNCNLKPQSPFPTFCTFQTIRPTSCKQQFWFLYKSGEQEQRGAKRMTWEVEKMKGKWEGWRKKKNEGERYVRCWLRMHLVGSTHFGKIRSKMQN